MLPEPDAMTAQQLRGGGFGDVSGFAHRRIVMATLRNGYLPKGQLCGFGTCGTIVRKYAGVLRDTARKATKRIRRQC
jgi:hypothetical protein